MVIKLRACSRFPFTGGTATGVVLSDCWKNIVQDKVTKYLHKVDMSSPSLAIMVDMLFMYDKLQQGTTELFGGHSQLALSLKDGFSKAFQSLNEVTGLKVCNGVLYI